MSKIIEKLRPLILTLFAEQVEAILTLAVIGKFFSAALYPLCTLLASDYYPSVCRETGVAFCVMLSRLFLIAVPFIIEGKVRNSKSEFVNYWKIILYF